MIRQVQSNFFLPDEDHRKPSIYQLLGARPGTKWLALQRHALPGASQANEWHRTFVGLRVETAPRSPASDDALFQQAAAKVNDRIRMDRKILGGAPCVAGTRIPVYAILQLIEAGYSHKKILKSFPSLSREDLEAALRFSALVMER